MSPIVPISGVRSSDGYLQHHRWLYRMGTAVWPIFELGKALGLPTQD
ncbi:hypothetical protein [Microseira sp. BLCC-F43]